MKLARYRSRAEPGVSIGVVEDGVVFPVARGSGAAGQSALLSLAMLRDHDPAVIGDEYATTDVELLCPVADPPSIRDFYAFEAHVATARRSRGLDMEPAWYDEPVFYFTNPAAVLGPGELVHPPTTRELDYELEVAAVIGIECRDVSADRWFEVVAGFTIMNDWSARDVQRREMRVGLGPAKGKDFATSLGPVLVTPDELVDAAGVPSGTMTARVNGEEWSRGELAELHFGWGELVAHASRDTRLRPGDVLGSGTVGTGCILELLAVHGGGRHRWLEAGDEVELQVEGIGVLANRVAPRGG